MLAYHPENNTNIIQITIDGKIRTEEFKPLLTQLETLIKQHGKIRILIKFVKLTNMDMRAFWDDLKFTLHHIKDISHYAVVGNRRWLEGWTTFINPFLKTEVKYFQVENIDQAWQWLHQV